MAGEDDSARRCVRRRGHRSWGGVTTLILELKTQAHWFFVYRSQSLTKSSRFDPWLSRNVKNTNWRRIDGCFEKNKNFIKVCNSFVVATLESSRGQFRGRWEVWLGSVESLCGNEEDGALKYTRSSSMRGNKACQDA